jgi:hypothetical protein
MICKGINKGKKYKAVSRNAHTPDSLIISILVTRSKL